MMVAPRKNNYKRGNLTSKKKNGKKNQNIEIFITEEDAKVAGTDRKERLKATERVLVWTFFLNFLVCASKIILGAMTGMLAILADGLHSLGDSLSNVIGYAGARLARRDPDKKFAYGYEKFEQIATLLIVAVLAISFFEILVGGVSRLFTPRPVQITSIMFWVIAGSMAVNIITVWYERGAGKRLKSDLLIADSAETMLDIGISAAVLAAMYLIKKTGFWRADGILSIVIAFSMCHTIYHVVERTVKALADAQVVPPEEVEKVVLAVPGAVFCHAVRSRGQKESFYIDLHLGVDQHLSIKEAHDGVCHNVKLALHAVFPGLKTAHIHLEPDDEDNRTRKNSVFREKDPYGH